MPLLRFARTGRSMYSAGGRVVVNCGVGLAAGTGRSMYSAGGSAIADCGVGCPGKGAAWRCSGTGSRPSIMDSGAGKARSMASRLGKVLFGAGCWSDEMPCAAKGLRPKGSRVSRLGLSAGIGLAAVLLPDCASKSSMTGNASAWNTSLII